MEHICIICAIQQEIRPILRLFPAIRISNFTDSPAWSFKAFGHNVTLIQSGIGISKAAKAAEAAAALNPQTIINAGFCGALSPAAFVGETFFADKLYRYHAGAITSEIAINLDFSERIGTGTRKGTFITTDKIIEKISISRLIPDPTATILIEMESAAIAEVCRSHSIKFAAIRCVSDAANNDPCNLFRRICDTDFSISVAKVIQSLLETPTTLPELVILSKNSRIAGKSLAAVVQHTLERI